MRQTVLGVYDSYAGACAAQRGLIDAGLTEADISIYAMSVSTANPGGPRVYAPGGAELRHDKPVFDQLEQLFARLFKRGQYPPETEDYREVIRRGGALLSADAMEAQVDLVCDVMRRTGACDIEERAKAWRSGSGTKAAADAQQTAVYRGTLRSHAQSTSAAPEQRAAQHHERPGTEAAATPWGASSAGRFDQPAAGPLGESATSPIDESAARPFDQPSERPRNQSTGRPLNQPPVTGSAPGPGSHSALSGAGPSAGGEPMSPNDIASEIPHEGESPLAGTASSLDSGSSVKGASRSGRSTTSSLDDGSSVAGRPLAGRSTDSSLDGGSSVTGGPGAEHQSTSSPGRESSVASNAPAGRPITSSEQPFTDDDAATRASATGERGDARQAGHRERAENPPSVGDPLLGTPLGDDGAYDDEFRRDYDSRYSESGTPYDEYQRAYTHGATLGNDERYRGSDWQKVEPSAREHWESHYPESAWDRFKAAVRHGWERVTDRRG
jgi:hypothetical protein